MDIKKLAKQIFDECAKDGEPITMAEAEEMAEMEIKAKGIKHYEKAEAEVKKDKKPRTIKISDEKVALFDLIWEGLSNFYGENATIQKENKEIAVTINDTSFKIDIVEHRKKK